MYWMAPMISTEYHFPTWHKGHHFQPPRNRIFLGTLSPRCMVYQSSISPLPMLGILYIIHWRCTNLWPNQLLSYSFWDANGEYHGLIQAHGINTNSRYYEIENGNIQQQGRHMEALQKLASIFKQATVNSDAKDSLVFQTSSTPTASKAVCTAPTDHGW